MQYLVAFSRDPDPGAKFVPDIVGNERFTFKCYYFHSLAFVCPKIKKKPDLLSRLFYPAAPLKEDDRGLQVGFSLRLIRNHQYVFALARGNRGFFPQYRHKRNLFDVQKKRN
jgi:hypothetical protein